MQLYTIHLHMLPIDFHCKKGILCSTHIYCILGRIIFVLKSLVDRSYNARKKERYTNVYCPNIRHNDILWHPSGLLQAMDAYGVYDEHILSVQSWHEILKTNIIGCTHLYSLYFAECVWHFGTNIPVCSCIDILYSISFKIEKLKNT